VGLSGPKKEAARYNSAGCLAPTRRLIDRFHAGNLAWLVTTKQMHFTGRLRSLVVSAEVCILATLSVSKDIVQCNFTGAGALSEGVIAQKYRTKCPAFDSTKIVAGADIRHTISKT
jgi:hypothetical protein